MKTGLNQNLDFYSIDSKMKAFSKTEGINYISISDILCNQEGCLTYMGNNFSVEKLINFDESHFTKNASDYVVSQFPPY